jgi:2,4'-dihydroxyacetophenone dioxygenase
MTTTSALEKQQATERQSLDQSKIAYQRPQAAGTVPDVIIGPALARRGTISVMS